jgi:hypothetical protein
MAKTRRQRKADAHESENPQSGAIETAEEGTAESEAVDVSFIRLS